MSGVFGQLAAVQYSASASAVPLKHDIIIGNCICHSQNWLCGPHLGGEPAGSNKTGGPVGSGDTNLMTPDAWPTQYIQSYHIHCVRLQTTDSGCNIGIYILGQNTIYLRCRCINIILIHASPIFQYCPCQLFGH